MQKGWIVRFGLALWLTACGSSADEADSEDASTSTFADAQVGDAEVADGTTISDASAADATLDATMNDKDAALADAGCSIRCADTCVGALREPSPACALLSNDTNILDMSVENGQLVYTSTSLRLLDLSTLQDRDVLQTNSTMADHPYERTPNHVVLSGDAAYVASDEGIYRINIESGSHTKLVSDAMPQHLAAGGGSVYYSLSPWGKGLYEVPLPGSPANKLTDAPVQKFVIDGSSIYFQDCSGASCSLNAAPLTNVASATVLERQIYGFSGLAIDANYVYFYKSGTYRIPKQGGTSQAFPSPPNHNVFHHYDAHGIYTTDSLKRQVLMFTPFDGSTSKVVLTLDGRDKSIITAVVSDDMYVYVSTQRGLVRAARP